MNKTTKIVLGSVLIAAAVGIYIYNNKATATVAVSPCPNGQIPCASNGKCYDPSLHYSSDPCGAAAVINVPVKNGIDENITKADINSTGLVTK